MMNININFFSMFNLNLIILIDFISNFINVNGNKNHNNIITINNNKSIISSKIQAN